MATLGFDSDDQRVANLPRGTQIEKPGAVLMQADPLSNSGRGSANSSTAMPNSKVQAASGLAWLTTPAANPRLKLPRKSSPAGTPSSNSQMLAQ